MKRTFSTAILVALLILTIFALNKVQAQANKPAPPPPITAVQR